MLRNGRREEEAISASHDVESFVSNNGGCYDWVLAKPESLLNR
jgi:hypothetical protein